jgi:hypothetical protein
VRVWLIATAFSTLPGCAGATLVDPPSERAVPIDTIDLSDDGQTVALRFIGSAPYVELDPCTASYSGLARVEDDVLEVGVVIEVGMLEHGEIPEDGYACDAMGYEREVTVDLAEPFTGIDVRDLVGFTSFLGRPPGLAELTALPNGWGVRSEGDLPESPSGRWSRIYSPAVDPMTSDPRLEVIQAFDGPADVSGGEEQSVVSVAGFEATLYRHAPSGELVLVWRPGPDGLALVANEKDFSAERLIELAETIVLHPD